MDKECIFLTMKARKSAARGSYAYREEGRPGNPSSIHPFSFENSRALYFPVGMTMRLARKDEQALRELREKALKDGHWKNGTPITHGIYQVRRNYGGICARGPRRKAMLNAHLVSTALSGTRVIIEEFKV